MGNVISLRRLSDGLRLSKVVARALREALLDNPLPRKKASGVPRSFKPANETSSNQYNVEKDQIWESLDPRDHVDGEQRQVQVVLVGASHALVDNLRSGQRSAIELKRFSGRTRKGFKLVVPRHQAAFSVVSN